MVLLALFLASAISLAASSTPAPAPAVSPVPTAGDMAPEFVYQSRDYLWQTFGNLLEQGHVVLVFGANDDVLRSLDQDRDALLARGIVPVAVIDRRDTDVWRIVRRLDLRFSLLSDPNGVIASQFGAWDEAHHCQSPMWVAVREDGRIESVSHGPVPTHDWAALSARALGLPATGSVRSARAR